MSEKAAIAKELSKNSGIDPNEIEALLEVPQNPSMGDLALPCFKLAKQLKKAPPVIANELSKIQFPDLVERIEVAGGYLNFFFDRKVFAESVMKGVFNAKNYGSTDEGQGRVICLDYSSINIAKPFHIGHLSTTVIGNSLYKIYEYLGYKCVGINHLGDYGTQFGKLIVAYKLWGNKDGIEKEGIDGMLRLYVRFHDEAEKNPALEDEAREWFLKIENGDSEALEIFHFFKDLTLKEVQGVYELLGIHFDSYAGESFYNDKMQRVIDELNGKNLLVESKGAKIVPLEEYGMPPCLILKADGASLYATRDIAAALYRKDTYNFYKSLYVVAYQQNLHFKQWFKVVELMGYDFQLEHVAFGMVSMEDGTLSTRKGKVIFLKDVLEKAIEKTAGIIEEKSPGLSNSAEIAKDIGVGAVVFGVLQNNRIKDITFSYDRALNFDGETGPYVQYTHARCCSVLKKAGYSVPDGAGYGLLCEDEAFLLLKEIKDFPAAIRSACAKNEPYLITRSITDVAKAYNRFYYEYRIMEQDEALKNARLALTDATRLVISTGLMLLGIKAPERM